MRKAGGAKEKGTMRRESSLVPTMILRVLLVEPDDSTRHVIAALLRKCGYRVTAVSDGLKAWELLKGASSNVDLVLTEVELPSVSGVALITLAMEQEIYKTIPFIMMSSCDSIGTVFNCMLKGAADYLVKPIRRNELHNLWQHVWRRRSVDENSPVDGPNSLQNTESTAESNALINRKHDIITSTEREDEFHHKGNFVQISPELEVIDLIGAFDDNVRRQHTDYFFQHPAKHPGLSTKLNLSLKRSEPHDLDDSETAERHNSLKKSNDSAFSWYIDNSLPKSCSQNNSSSETPTSLSTPKSILSFPTSWTKQTQHILPHKRPFTASARENVLSSNGPNTNLVLPSPGLDSHQDASLQLNSCDQSIQKISNTERPTTHSNDQSVYNESLSRLHEMNLGKFTGSGASACPNEDKDNNFTILDGLSQRAHKREAALMKFRLKKKVLCFEKKVRYESRKKLAEKRPRVKGQFVRQKTFDMCTH